MISAPLPADELQRIAALRALNILDTAPEVEFDEIVALASRLCDCPTALVSLVDEDRQWFKSRKGLDSSSNSREVSVCSHAILGKGLFEIPDLSEDERFHDNPHVTSEEKFRFYAGVPLVTADGSSPGALCVLDRTPKKLTTVQVDTLQALARQASRLLDLRLATQQLSAANHQVQTSNRFLASLLESAGQAIISYNLDGVIVCFNPEAVKLTGYEASVVIDKASVLTLFDLQDLRALAAKSSADAPADALPPLDALNMGVVNYDRHAVDLNLIRRDGSTVPTSCVVSPLLDDDNRTTGFVLLATDITERVRSAQERDRIFNLSLDLLAVGSFDGYFQRVNPAWTACLGWSASEMTSQPWLDFVHPDDLDKTLKAAEAVFQGESLLEFENRYRTKSGSYRTLSWNVQTLLETRQIFCVARDVTEKALAQVELSISEAWFRSFFEQSAVGMVVASEDGRFLQVNRRFAEIIGHTQKEIIGNQCAEATHPDDRAHEAESIKQLLGGEAEYLSWEKRYLRPDGSVIWCQLSLSLLSMTGNDTRQFIGIVQDISERVRAQESLRQSQEILRIASRVAKLGGWSLDLERQSVQWSDEVRAIHEVPDDFQPTLEQAFNFYPPESRGMMSEVVGRCVSEGTPFSLESELVTATGRRIWVHSSGEAARDDHGMVVRISGALQDITSRKEAEASLTESQRRFRVMADSFPFIVWTATPDGQVDFVNRAFTARVAADESAGPGVDWTPYLHPDDLARTLKAWRVSLNAGTSYAVEYRMRTAKNNDYHWYYVQAQPTRDDKGAIVKWYGAATDIHETKLLDEQARSLANRLNNTLESITDGFFVLNREWNVTFLNTQAGILVGRSPEQLLGKNFWEEYPHAIGSNFEDQYRNAINEGIAVHFQEFYPEPLHRWYDVSAYPSDEGLAVYFRDVTQSRAAQAQLRLLETAVGLLNDIVLITEAEPLSESGPKIVFVNDAFERRTGYTRDEVMGKTPRILQGPKTQKSELARIRKALTAWEPVRAELINYTKNGEEFWLELDVVPIADEKGWYTHWVAVERDITERKIAQQEILDLNAELEDRVKRRTHQLELANNELEAFSYSVSHDLRSPLATIGGFSQMLLKTDGNHLSEKGQHYLNRISLGVNKMGELIDCLLSLAKIARASVTRTQVDLTELAAKIVQQLRDAEADRTVDVHIGADLAVNADSAMAAVVMHNLVGNAWKYSAKNPQAAIEIGSKTSASGELYFFVSDNGAGFDMAYSDKLFDAFQRLHNDSEFKGTGIGLANVKRAIDRQGGHIWFDAAPGKGATFYFTFESHAVIANADLTG